MRDKTDLDAGHAVGPRHAAAGAVGQGLRRFVADMVTSPILATTVALVILARRPDALRRRAPHIRGDTCRPGIGECSDIVALIVRYRGHDCRLVELRVVCQHGHGVRLGVVPEELGALPG